MSAGPRLHRRTALALGAAGLAAVAGCDEGPESPVPTPAPSPDADEALVDGVVAEIAAVWRLTAGRPGLAAVHEAHAEALGGELTGARRRGDTAALRGREEALRVRLVDAAMAADSGELARLLASMSAAVSQQLVAQ
ncbi:hypothetical protein GCM10027062_08640 [Nocardioides hungaricus]